MWLFPPTFAKIKPLYPCHSAHIMNKGMIPLAFVRAGCGDTRIMCVFLICDTVFVLTENGREGDLCSAQNNFRPIFSMKKAR